MGMDLVHKSQDLVHKIGKLRIFRRWTPCCGTFLVRIKLLHDVPMKFAKSALSCLVSAVSSPKKNFSAHICAMMKSTLSTIDDGTATMRKRSSEAELRRASGGKSLEIFSQTVQGWTATEIDALNDGKSPVHMAAWKGCLENLKYLRETLACNIDIISTGEFSYGKTPIFFALTQSREDVVVYLLDQGACVKIVNNKGQSPLSIAASHLSEAAISRIQSQEQNQMHVKWTKKQDTYLQTMNNTRMEFLF